jgi:hypothetical protein
MLTVDGFLMKIALSKAIQLHLAPGQMYNCVETGKSEINFKTRFGSKLRSVNILKASISSPACAVEAWVQLRWKIYKEPTQRKS